MFSWTRFTTHTLVVFGGPAADPNPPADEEDRIWHGPAPGGFIEDVTDADPQRAMLVDASASPFRDEAMLEDAPGSMSRLAVPSSFAEAPSTSRETSLSTLPPPSSEVAFAETTSGGVHSPRSASLALLAQNTSTLSSELVLSRTSLPPSLLPSQSALTRSASPSSSSSKCRIVAAPTRGAVALSTPASHAAQDRRLDRARSTGRAIAGRAQSTLHGIAAERDAMRRERDRLLQEAAEKEADAQGIRVQLSDARLENRRCQQRLRKLTTEVARMRRAHARLVASERAAHKAAMEQKEGVVQELQRHLLELEETSMQQEADMQARLHERENELAAVRSRCTELEAQLDDTRDELDELRLTSEHALNNLRTEMTHTAQVSKQRSMHIPIH
jgi:hypothetical protein